MSIAVLRRTALYSGLVVALLLSTQTISWSENSSQLPAVKDEYKIDPLVMRQRNANRVKGFTQSVDEPSGFPVPVYDSGKITANFCVTNNAAGSLYAGTVMTKDAPLGPYSWYKQHLSSDGWVLNKLPQSKAEKSGKVFIVSATRGATTATVTAIKAHKGDFSLVNISCFTQKRQTGRQQ